MNVSSNIVSWLIFLKNEPKDSCKPSSQSIRVSYFIREWRDNRSIFFGTYGKVDIYIGPSISCVKSNISFICYLKSTFGSNGMIHYKGLDMCVCFPMETQRTPQARQETCAN